eukprot:1139334-Pelagomonas_calceolata.AAC.13
MGTGKSGMVHPSCCCEGSLSRTYLLWRGCTRTPPRLASAQPVVCMCSCTAVCTLVPAPVQIALRTQRMRVCPICCSTSAAVQPCFMLVPAPAQMPLRTQRMWCPSQHLPPCLTSPPRVSVLNA